MTSTVQRDGKRRKIDSTEMTAAILSILEQADRPLTAYGILALAAEAGVPLYPNQIYRTIRRLVVDERVTRIETANAYMIRQTATGMVAVCRCCSRAFPLRIGRQLDGLTETIRAAGFVVEDIVIEAVVRCPDCGERHP